MGRLSELYHRDDRLRLLSGVGAKHSDIKSRVSAIGYCPNASPVQGLNGEIIRIVSQG